MIIHFIFLLTSFINAYCCEKNEIEITNGTLQNLINTEYNIRVHTEHSLLGIDTTYEDLHPKPSLLKQNKFDILEQVDSNHNVIDLSYNIAALDHSDIDKRKIESTIKQLRRHFIFSIHEHKKQKSVLIGSPHIGSHMTFSFNKETTQDNKCFYIPNEEFKDFLKNLKENKTYWPHNTYYLLSHGQRFLDELDTDIVDTLFNKSFSGENQDDGYYYTLKESYTDPAVTKAQRRYFYKSLPMKIVRYGLLLFSLFLIAYRVYYNPIIAINLTSKLDLSLISACFITYRLIKSNTLVSFYEDSNWIKPGNFEIIVPNKHKS